MADAEKLARRIHALERTTAGLARTQQIARSSVTVTDAGEDEAGEPIAESRDVPLGDVLAGAVDTAEDVASHSEDLELLDESTTQTVEDTADLFLWDGDRGDEVYELALQGIDTLEAVNTAQAAAEAAANAAANAQTTADGKNARRRGKTQPEAPPGGWKPGDQWVRDNDAGRPVELLVWNGTAFVRDQILASELLVLGEEGTVQIGNGKVTAPALAVDALDFKTARGLSIVGGEIIGGTFALADLVSRTPVLTSDCETLTNWYGQGGGPEPTLSTVAHSGTRSVSAPAKTGAYLVAGGGSGVDADSITAWLRSPVAQNITVSAQPALGRVYAGQIPANTWTQIRVPTNGRKTLFYVGFSGDAEDTLYIDDVAVYREDMTNDSGLRIYRETSGAAKVTSYGTGGERMALSSGRLDFSNAHGPGSAVLTTMRDGGFTGTYLDMKGEQDSGASTNVWIYSGYLGARIHLGTGTKYAQIVGSDGDLTLRADANRTATVIGPLLELSLPEPVKTNYNGAANLTAAAGVWQDVPSIAKAQITNPGPKRLLCRVDFGAIVSASAGYTMLAVACSGATVIGVQQETKPGDLDTFGALHTPFSATTTQLALTGVKTVYLNPGTTTFTLRSMRSATGTHVTNYPSLLVEPRRFLE